MCVYVCVYVSVARSLPIYVLHCAGLLQSGYTRGRSRFTQEHIKRGGGGGKSV